MLEFVGIPSGDGEAFCWAVSDETFQRIKGRAPEEYDESPYLDEMFMLYPSDLLYSAFGHRPETAVRVTVTCEVLPE